MFDLTGHVALVTGAGQNVARGIACALAGQGAPWLSTTFHADRAMRVAEEINQAGGQAVAIRSTSPTWLRSPLDSTRLPPRLGSRGCACQ